MFSSKMTKRFIAGFLALAMAFVVPGVHMQAAQSQKTVYIKDLKLYIDNNKNPEAAKKWFEKNDYTMIEGNLNAEASGALKKEVGVYLGYSTTTNASEAVTDIAVMNERGNYSQGEYKRILEEQKKMYDDMVTDIKDMLEQYRTNVENGVPTAIQSRDFMNGYKDDESGQLLGDLLMSINDEDLGTLLMQANGQIVLMIEDRLAYACESENSNWLDRMAKLGSYKNLEKKALKAANNDITKAKKALDKKYKEDALTLANSWEDLKSHFDKARDYEEKFGLKGKSADEIEKFLNSNSDNIAVQEYLDKTKILSTLACYKYEDASLCHHSVYMRFILILSVSL